MQESGSIAHNLAAQNLPPSVAGGAPSQLQFPAELFGIIPEPGELEPLGQPPHLRLVVDTDAAMLPAWTPPLQLALPELFAPGANVVRLVPRDRYPALDRHFPSLVADDRKLSRFALGLALEGRVRLGDIVQLSALEILERCRSDRAVLARLESELASFGLGLGMVAPRWRSPGGLVSACW
jgi:hypothetical protein